MGMRNGSPHYWLMHAAVMAGLAVFAYLRDPGNTSNLVMLGGLSFACIARWLYLLWKLR